MAETSSSAQNLPNDEPIKGNSTAGGVEDTEGLSTGSEKTEQLTPEQKEGFHRALSKKDQELKELQERLADQSQKLSQLEKERRAKELEKLDESEKWKILAEEKAEEAAQARLQGFVSMELAKRSLSNHPVASLLLNAPWSIPGVNERVKAGADWDETIQLVQNHLPSYLDTLVMPGQETPAPQAQPSTPQPQVEEESEGMETERSTPVETPKKVWTRKEIARYLEEAVNDRKEFNKRNLIVTRAVTEGRVK